MNYLGIFLTLLSATIVLAPLGSLKSVSAFEQIGDRAAKPILIARGRGGIGATLGGVVHDGVEEITKDREAFVKGEMKKATDDAGGKYNVMVFNLKQPHLEEFKNKKYREVKYKKLTYGIWTFRDGKFTNKGDGGSINWAFSGNFKTSGKQGHTVSFSKR
jgi:hypothetical protein